MIVTVTTLSGEIFCVDADPNMDLFSLKVICSNELGLPVSLFLNGNLLDNDTKKLRDYGIASDEMLLAEVQERSVESRQTGGSGTTFAYYDKEQQQRIEEKIRMEDIERSRIEAMEFYPESFARVYLLYIDCRINNVPIKALVDSGAQCSIMSEECAQKCDLMRLVDPRYSKTVQGIGKRQTLGKIHLSQVQIGNAFLNCSFSVMKEPVDVLLGLDMLRRFQCTIDLEKNELVIGTTDTRVSFLSEADIPSYAKLTYQEEINKPAEEGEIHSPDVREATIEIKESDIQVIVRSGFTREQAIEELRQSKGDVQIALSSLVARSLVF